MCPCSNPCFKTFITWETEREREKLIQKLRETQRGKKGKEEPKKLGSEDAVSGEGR